MQLVVTRVCAYICTTSLHTRVVSHQRGTEGRVSSKASLFLLLWARSGKCVPSYWHPSRIIDTPFVACLSALAENSGWNVNILHVQTPLPVPAPTISGLEGGHSLATAVSLEREAVFSAQ